MTRDNAIALVGLELVEDAELKPMEHVGYTGLWAIHHSTSYDDNGTRVRVVYHTHLETNKQTVGYQILKGVQDEDIIE